MIPTKLNPLGVNPYEKKIMEFKEEEPNIYRCYGLSTQSGTPTIENPVPIIPNYKKGKYKTNIAGLTIDLKDDLRGIVCTRYEKHYSDKFDYIEYNSVTKEKKLVKNTNIINNFIKSNANLKKNDGDFKVCRIYFDYMNLPSNIGTGEYEVIYGLCNIYPTTTEHGVLDVGTVPNKLGFSNTGRAGYIKQDKEPDIFSEFLDNSGIEIIYALKNPIVTII